jgi:anaerobic magnesium-protoporphyrin IX monomethyl ester cyclase
MKKASTATRIALVNSPLIEADYSHPLFPPLGLAYLAAVLEQNNFEIKIMDCPVCRMDHKKLGANLAAFKPDLIGIASMTPTIPSAMKSAQVAKEVCPDATVIMGGPHATFADKQILADEQAVDIVVRGEGEETLLEIAQRSPKLNKLQDVKGVTFRSKQQIVQTPNRPFIENLDELPRPAYNYLPIDMYRIHGKKFLPIMTSRGCPFQCAFCSASRIFGAGYRARSPENVLAELEWLRDVHGAEGVSFHDDTLTFDKKRIMDICDGIINRKIGLPWGCSTRVDLVTEEILTKMAKANCNEVCFGVESGCQKILNAVHKRVSPEQNEKAIKWAKDAGMFVTVSVIIGYPGETKETVQETLNLIHRVEPDEVWLCLPTPYPGTELRTLVESLGWKMSDDWTLYNTMNTVFENPDLPAGELIKMRQAFYNKFYSPKYVIRQFVKGNLKGNLYSKIMARTAVNYLLWRAKASL